MCRAQSKDFGIIPPNGDGTSISAATGGNARGTRCSSPEDLDDDTLIAYIDRYLMYYIHTGADRLERTATWLEKLEAGSITSERSSSMTSSASCRLEADMQRHVDNYECEWKASIEDPIGSAVRLVRQRTR